MHYPTRDKVVHSGEQIIKSTKTKDDFCLLDLHTSIFSILCAIPYIHSDYNITTIYSLITVYMFTYSLSYMFTDFIAWQWPMFAKCHSLSRSYSKYLPDDVDVVAIDIEVETSAFVDCLAGSKMS